MDEFVTISRQKENEEIVGRDSDIKYIKSLIESNTSFCVYGSIGVGKTFLIKHALLGIHYIELTSELFTSLFTERLKSMNVHVVADTLDVSEPLSLGSTIVISDKIIENLLCIKIESLSVEDIIHIGTKKFPGTNEDKIRQHAISSNGDIRTFLFRMNQFTDVKDLFKSPKDFVYDLLCQGGCLEPWDYIGRSVMEHGYSWGIVHENYLDSPSCSINNNMYLLADMMSYADIKDADIYSSGYSSQKYIFSLFGILLPAITIDHTLDRNIMRPGSAWTKFNNYKMRFRRFQSLTNRKVLTKIDIDSLMVISQYCKNKPSDDIMSLLNFYGFESADIDMMNHISLLNKIKPRILQTIKTKLKLLAKE